MTDLVRRLRDYPPDNPLFDGSVDRDIRAAADLLERAVKVMRPFEVQLEYLERNGRAEWPDTRRVQIDIPLRDLRAARDLIKEIEGDPT